jgi:AcrR family transcriptional regulator
MASTDTKERILDAAEAVFAEQGYAGASLRAITGAAEVNLAAVHYHFGSKEGLYRAVFQRRIEPVNRVRLERLDELERVARGGRVPLEKVVRAFIEPAIRVSREWDASGQLFLRISGRMFSEPGEHWREIGPVFAEVQARFVAAFQRSLPEHDATDVFWRIHLMLGVLCHSLSAGSLLEFVSSGACNGEDPDETLAHLIPFLTAGVRARTQSEAHTEGEQVRR